MFTKTAPAKYKFKYNGITHYVIEDEPESDCVRTRNVYGTTDFPKSVLQELIEKEEAEISSE